MMRIQVQSFIAIAALAAAPAFANDFDQPIEVNTDGLQSHVAAQVREHAAESQQSLMQYLWFTRRMNHLWIDDVTKAKPELVAEGEPQVEKREIKVVRVYSNR